MRRLKMKKKEFDNETKREVWELYFQKMYSMDELVEHFQNKLNKFEIRRIIDEKYRRTL